MSVIDNLKQRLTSMQKEETLPEISEEMKKVLGEQVAGGVDVWARAKWTRAIG